jgi:Zn-dependent protease/predicted transcriptional regulator
VSETSRSGVPLGRIFGIEIRVDVSWIVIFALVTLSLANYFAGESPGATPAQSWAAAVVGSLIFFASILGHELMHSLIAKAQGTAVTGITLFIFGGVAKLQGEPKRPVDELLVAAVGPAFSALIGAAFLALQSVWPPNSIYALVAGWVGATNLGLAVFNLLPGFPLDGGRVFRAVAWSITGDLRRATRLAASTGSAVAYALIILGMSLVVAYGAVLNGLWIAFIGWFLLSAAKGSVAHMELTDVLSRLAVGAAMRRDCPTIPGDESVASLVEDQILRTGRKCFFVSDNGHFEGLVTLHEVKERDRSTWPDTAVRDIMIPAGAVKSVRPADSLLEAMRRMDESNVDQLPVVEEGSLQGIVSREDVLHAVALHLELRS